jgi:holliday junction DNA helicase RuvA
MVDVNGVGYEVDVPMSTFYPLPAIGERVQLLTHLAVREDAHQLYGFATRAERTAFRELIRISGVGARTALAVLSGLSVAELEQAVTVQDAARLTRIPGIGKKTAERLMLELKGKLGADLGHSRRRAPRQTRHPTSCGRCSRLATTSAKRPRHCAACLLAAACPTASASP